MSSVGECECHVKVGLGDRSYSIHIGNGTLRQLGEALSRVSEARKAMVVTVPEVGRRYAGRVVRSLRSAGIKAHKVEVPDGDSSKNIRQVAKLYDAFLEKGLDRSSLVIALGGGMVGDLAGFAAATYLRGISFVQVPTTVLSMVDASIGGKVGINLKQGKNLAGAFHQPKLVWLDTETLESLPRRQRRAGLAEIIKAAAIWDESYFEALERDIPALLDLEPDRLIPALERACEIKAEVVSRDEREGGLRMLLNFGHTLAHAVENLTGYRRVLHGEAVGMGMVFAAELSERLELAPTGTAERLRSAVDAAELAVEPPTFPRKAYLSALSVDKKRTDAHIRFVVLRSIGRAETLPLTPAEILPPGRRSWTTSG